MSDVAWDVFPFWLRGWGWWTLTGVLHELDKILSHPTPSVLEVLLAIVEVTERGISETRQDEQSPSIFSLQCSHISKETGDENKENNQLSVSKNNKEKYNKIIPTHGHHTGYTQHCELYSRQRHKQPNQQDKRCL